ncbi:uncharacterized protein SPPG_03058 [Spizellomyces punctatus DAOM BR117]|uniref:Uncharacterized protein n=1 Tax=Spizellomyces punctatus (strain DAOM BR117) TaxID=645134 RepID=A0A0L0HNU0_SPIPD|nr:uncharacterized protein SPPG_03058 [Spizellomyces punctatus DAOM BR117]KND02605.1 hypothetical protein SPPG_03058 [Spizellomyces punctatus DAOM BR117]|eukprot:XP_016610644.1 hypothetical protein SPPG_03058 [Spizellomyces punctatus DAOM BR117]
MLLIHIVQQVVVANGWLAPVRRFIELQSIGSDVKSSINTAGTHLERHCFLLLGASITYNIGIVTGWAVYMQLHDAGKVFLFHTLFNSGTFLCLIVLHFLCSRSFTRILVALGEADNLHKQVLALIAALVVGGNVRHATTNAGNNVISGDGRKVLNVIRLVKKTRRAAWASAGPSFLIQSSVLLWTVIARTPEGMNGQTYLFCFRSLATAPAVIASLWMYGVVKGRERADFTPECINHLSLRSTSLHQSGEDLKVTSQAVDSCIESKTSRILNDGFEVDD